MENWNQINKKLGRAVIYSPDGQWASLYTFEPGTDGPIVLIKNVPRGEAHEWFHGQEARGVVPETDPTVDEMIEVVAAKVQAEVEAFMDMVLTDTDSLRYAYRSARCKNEKLLRVWMA